MGAVILPVPVTVQVPEAAIRAVVEAATPGVKEEYPRNSGRVGNRLGPKTDDRNERIQFHSNTLQIACELCLRHPSPGPGRMLGLILRRNCGSYA